MVHAKNWWLNYAHLTQETDCRPLTSRVSHFTPYGRILVSLTSLYDIPGCNIEMLEPVSIIKALTFFYTYINRGSIVPQRVRNCGPNDSIYCGIKEGGAVFLHNILPFSEVSHSFLKYCSVGGGVFCIETRNVSNAWSDSLFRNVGSFDPF